MTEPRAAGHSSGVGQTPSLMSTRALAAVPPQGTAAPAARMPESFDEIYEAHFDFVWRSLRRLGVSEVALDDAVQDVFLVVHRRLGDFEARSAMKTWLFGIAMRVAQDHRRAARRKGALETLPESLADAAPGPLELLEASEALKLLDRALSKLDEEKRAVFVLAEIEEMTAPEIADTLGVKLNTVYSRLRAARHELEATLDRIREERP